MALPATGTIALSQVNTELSLASTTNISLNQSNVRTLFGKASGAIAMSDGYSKSNAVYATLNPADKSTTVALSNGNLTATFTGNGMVRGTVTAPANAGVWRYFETTIVSVGSNQIGIGQAKPTAPVDGGAYFNGNFDWINNQSSLYVYPSFSGLSVPTFGAGAVIGWAFSGGGVRVYVNGAYQGGMSCEAADFKPMVEVTSYSGGTIIMTCNFGASPFVYTNLGMGGWVA